VTITGIVLGGGRSSRFGGPKLQADFGGRTVLEATIAALRPAVTEIVIVGPSIDSLPANRVRPTASRVRPTASRVTLDQLAAEPDVRIVHDSAAFAGPLAGLREGLAAASSEVALVLGGDMPLTRAAVLAELHAWLIGRGLDAVALEAEPPHPLPLALRRVAALSATEELLDRGERSLRALLTALGAVSIPGAEWRRLDPSGDSLVDVDRPEDLARALGRIELERSARER
jgi:molybdopterin-guanine dinucleotide biosynthesis protein A